MATHPNPESDDAYYRAVLHDLIDRGADLARHVHEQATTPQNTPETPKPDPTVAFERIARTVRRTVALARHIAAHPAAKSPAAKSPAAAQTTKRAQLIRGVEDAIHRQRHATDADALYAEFAERLEEPELELDLQGRSVDDLIEEIARDLGVAVQGRSWVWKRRTPADIASLRARAAPTLSHALHRPECGRTPGAAPPPQPNGPKPPA